MANPIKRQQSNSRNTGIADASLDLASCPWCGDHTLLDCDLGVSSKGDITYVCYSVRKNKGDDVQSDRCRARCRG